jgi:penicillin-binding protein 2
MIIFDQLNKNDPQLRTITLAVLAGMATLLAGLWYVQVVSADRYKSSLKHQSFRTVRIPAARGKILDRDGIVLAENRPSYNVSLYLHELRSQFAYEYTNHIVKEYLRTNRVTRIPRSMRPELQREARYRVASNIVAQLSGQLDLPVSLDAAKFHRHYTGQLALPLTVVSKLDSLHIARFHENSMGMPGVDLEVQAIRVYPYGPLAAQTLGHLRRDDSSISEDEGFFNFRLPDFKGAVGIEKLFDQELAGKAGVKSVLVNSGGYRQSDSEWAPAEAGRNVVLTLTAPIQLAAERALASGPQGTNTRGAIVVMDVNSGDVLAMASSPSFNPNQFVPRLPSELMDRLNDPELRPTFNRATHGAYAPGSIFKIITGLAALEAGLLDPTETYHSPGYYELGPRQIVRDTANGGLPCDFDFKKAFKLSSNAYFVNCGQQTGEEPILNLSQHLHLGERIGILPGQEVAGVLPTKEWLRRNRYQWYKGDTANLSIGQGYLTVTPIQMAVMVSSVANGGKIFQPRLVDRVEPQGLSGDEPVRFPARRLRDRLPVSQKNLDIVRAAMLADVEEEGGTGRGAGLPGMRVCGKTGTAEVKQGREVIDKITWFASFAPFESPLYAVVVMVESGSSGAKTCAPLARIVYQALHKREQSYPAKPETVAAR